MQHQAILLQLFHVANEGFVVDPANFCQNFGLLNLVHLCLLAFVNEIVKPFGGDRKSLVFNGLLLKKKELAVNLLQGSDLGLLFHFIFYY